MVKAPSSTGKKWTTSTTIGLVAIIGYYSTAAFIVARTGSTTGISDLTHGAAIVQLDLDAAGATRVTDLVRDATRSGLTARETPPGWTL